VTAPRVCPTCNRPVAPRPLHTAQWITVQEAADVLRVSKMTVYRLCHEGSLGARRFGRSFRIPRQGLDRFINGAAVSSEEES
jgi:excisionase family DNA binding protein